RAGVLWHGCGRRLAARPTRRGSDLGGGGGDDVDRGALVALLDDIGRAGGARNVEPVLLPLIGDRIVGLAGAGAGAEGLALLRGAGDQRRRHAGRLVDDRAGRRAGLAVAAGVVLHDALPIYVDRGALVALLDDIGRAGGARNVEPVLLPLIGDRIVGLAGAGAGAEGLALLR